MLDLLGVSQQASSGSVHIEFGHGQAQVTVDQTFIVRLLPWKESRKFRCIDDHYIDASYYSHLAAALSSQSRD